MINIPKGTKDMLPEEAYKWHFVESEARKKASLYGYKEIRTPMFEHTELFLRGVGETTDIVTKEMYTFQDKGGRSLTLRPEGTAGVARCFVGNALNQGVLPMKAYYLSSVFRYEKPQNGRLREHHQFGVECYGSDSPYADAEVIALAYDFLHGVGLDEIELNINSIGCPECRKRYNDALKSYIGDNLQNMCGQCRERFDKNPLRILDCKEERCREIVKNAPNILDYLCDDCNEHFHKVLAILDGQGIKYKVNGGIVRGLDYYTRTVFEFVSTSIGSQGTVCGGGRYNNLVEEIGGKPTPCVGFGLGLERLLMVLENTNKLDCPKEFSDVYLLAVGDEAEKKVVSLAAELRSAGVKTEYDIMGRGIKAQMKYADRSGTSKLIVIGGDELASGKVKIKCMQTGEETECSLSDVVKNLKQ